MSHIHTKPGQHDFTVSAFIIRLDDGVPKAMVHKHKKLGIYLQFGGHVELDENPWQAITRELQEETGYTLDQLHVLQPKERLIFSQDGHKVHPYPLALQTHPFGTEPHKHDDICFAFITQEQPQSKPHAGEVTEFALLSVEELQELTNTQIPSTVRQIFLFAIQTCLPSWEKVLTASI